MTTRHASLAPIELVTFRRERRLMQSKHLWDNFSIDWYKLDSKLYNAKPTGHSRELLWNYLFVQKHRQNPFQEREYQGHDAKNVYNKWYADQRYMKAYQSTKTLRGIDVDAAMMWGSTLKTSQQSKHSWMPRISMPADGRPRKALTASKENFFRMFGTLMLRWLTSPLFPDRLITVNRPERGKPYGGWVWAAELCGFLQEFDY